MWNNKTTFKLKNTLPSNEIGNDFILLDSSNKKAHELNVLGKFIWQQLNEEISLENLKDRLMKEYEVDQVILDQDVRVFLTKLHDKNLIDINELL
jgi:hypothetical protein